MVSSDGMAALVHALLLVSAAREAAAGSRPSEHPASPSPVSLRHRLDDASHVVVGVGALGAANACSGELMKLCGCEGFPAPIASMLLIGGGMYALDAISPERAASVAAHADPICVFLRRWFALFYVPGQVSLPFVIPALRTSQVVAFSAFCVVSIVLNAAFTARTAELFLPRMAPRVRPQKVAPIRVAAPSSKQRVTARTQWLAALSVLLASGALVTRSPLALHPCFFACTLLCFDLAERMPARVRLVLPTLLAAAIGMSVVLRVLAAGLGMSAEGAVSVYNEATGRVLRDMLRPAVASFAFSLFEHRRAIRARANAVAGAISLSCVGSIAAGAIAARALRMDPLLRLALVPRALTNAIAMEAGAIVGADEGVTLLGVIVTGTAGIPLGLPVLSWFRVADPAARGLALGCAANGGGVLALLGEPDAFPYAVGSTALCGALTVILLSIPPLRQALLWLLGVPTSP